MKTLNRFVTAVFVVLLTFASCSTDADLCYEQEHPHKSGTYFDYNWSHANEDSMVIPDSMFVLGERIVSSWKGAVKVGTEEQTGKWLRSSTPRTSEQLESQNLRCFDMPAGTYKFITFNLDTTCFNKQTVQECIDDETDSCKVSGLMLQYKGYKKDSPEIVEAQKEWTDYNAYADFILKKKETVLYDTIEIVELPKAQTFGCMFSPRPLLQNIDIFFDIQKEMSEKRFMVDSVKAEISGIPASFNLYNGHLDITRTHKMLMKMDIDKGQGVVSDAGDSMDNTSLRCHSNINVSGVIYGPNERATTGPGILQVLVYVTSEDDENTHRKIQGKINLYHTIKDSGLIDYNTGEDYALQAKRTGVLDIKAHLVINGAEIKGSDDSDWGIDQWVPSGTIYVDF